MARVSIVSSDKAQSVESIPATGGTVAASAYFDGERKPLHLHKIDLAEGQSLELTGARVDRVGYVLSGTAHVGDHALKAGSSFIVERDSAVSLEARGESATVLLFAATHEDARPGGNVHLLPYESVPRAQNMGSGSGVGGAIHANSESTTSTVWLHENMLPGMASDGVRRDSEAGVHAHSEDEIIFVTGGQIRLGARLYDPGTALLIAADTLYSFTPGPEGVSFVNFRAAKPSDIRFANGKTMDETAYWRDRLPAPEYIDL